MIIPVKTQFSSYDIVFNRGALKKANEYLSLNRNVLIVTDDGVPSDYSKTVASLCKKAVIITLKQGEKSKNFDNYKYLLEVLVENGFTRTDCVVAVGGGVIGDLAGFVASSYMRGIDFYNIPTTVLSQVDSAVGGKTAIDFAGVKNIVGAFYPPKGVIIDADTLSTLPKRHISNGLAESVKMSLTCDSELFNTFERGYESIDTVIERSVLIKRDIVEKDERESGLRKVLNFGHTLAHAIESVSGMDKYLHGECVAMGMLPMCSKSVRKRLEKVLIKLDLPTEIPVNYEDIKNVCRLDKKMSGDNISVVTVENVGSYKIKKMSFDDFLKEVRK
ncbi:MAG: 3-dehydroquinate synthase [Clostridia bacterium]|nr:3-dehydroquinate synthase [Clostridia bacterium]